MHRRTSSRVWRRSRRDFDDHRIGDRRRHGVDDGPRDGDDHPRRARARPYGEHGRRAARGGSDPGGAADPGVRRVTGSARAAALLVPPGAVPRHWPEYAIEAACLGLFMISACVFVTLLEHPLSPARAAVADPTLRRVLVGVAMGLTARPSTPGSGPRSGCTSRPRRSACWPPPRPTSVSPARARSGAPSCITTTRSGASFAAAIPWRRARRRGRPPEEGPWR